MFQKKDSAKKHNGNKKIHIRATEHPGEGIRATAYYNLPSWVVICCSVGHQKNSDTTPFLPYLNKVGWIQLRVMEHDLRACCYSERNGWPYLECSVKVTAMGFWGNVIMCVLLSKAAWTCRYFYLYRKVGMAFTLQTYLLESSLRQK